MSVGCREDARDAVERHARDVLGQRGRLTVPYFAHGDPVCGRAGSGLLRRPAGGRGRQRRAGHSTALGRTRRLGRGHLVGRGASGVAGPRFADVLAWLKSVDPGVFARHKIVTAECRDNSPRSGWSGSTPTGRNGRRAGLAFGEWVCTPAEGLIVGGRIEVQLPIPAGGWPEGDPD